mgnify:CR=1 FL=1
MTFDTNRQNFTIETFEIVIIETDIVGPTCTVNGQEGWYTPLTCDETTVTGQKQHVFCTPNFPSGIFDLLNVDEVFPQLSNISETPARIRPGRGLAGRGTLRFSLKDFPGDPGPTRESAQGDYIAKLRRRNILENKSVTIMLGHVIDGAIAMDDLQSRHYVIDEFQYDGDGEWTITCKDELYLLDDDESIWPPETNGSLRSDITNSVTTIPVDAGTDYSTAEVVRVGDELMAVVSVAGNMTSSAALTVATRGSNITNVAGDVLSITQADSHESGDEVFICRVIDDTRLDTLLTDILTEVGVPAARIPSTDWTSEIDLWHPATRVNTIYTETDNVNRVVAKILSDFLMDIWFDPVSRSVRLSAISVWRQTDITVNEGVEIEAASLNYNTRPEGQFTRTSILYDKRNLTEADEVTNFRKLSRNVNATAEADYGVRPKRLDPSILLDQTAADLLTQRHTTRFSVPPVTYRWVTREQFLNFTTGDVTNINSPELIGFDGLPQVQRAQITRVRPVYNRRQGRLYNIEAEAYEPPIADPDAPLEFFITGRNYNLNLHVLAGAPPMPVNVTFILNTDAIVGSMSTSFDQPAVRAGNFAPGSEITIIQLSGSKWSSKAGFGGSGGVSSADSEFTARILPRGGDDGGLVYDAEGVNTIIWLSGTVGARTANGEMRAPGGGGAGGIYSTTGTSTGGGGGGGTGIDPGVGGASSGDDGFPNDLPFRGADGDEDGNGGAGGTARQGTGTGAQDGGDGGDWGLAGGSTTGDGQTFTGGSAGHALRKGGATITIHGSANFTQGGGDAPDNLNP